MLNLDKFYNDSRSLSNSLVVKINDIAKAMEIAYLMPLDLSLHDHTKFRYYQHLKGEYYVSPPEYGYDPPYKDREVLIKVIETEEFLVLTKDLLELYQVTREELLKQGDYYIDLINNNPDMITFIHGCLFPNDYTLEELIDLPDGSIIGYNPTLVEPQEYDLIPKLEKYIQDVLGRWHVNDYMVGDELYIHSMLAVLYGHIPNKIVNIRLNNIRSHQVHSFFLEVYFNSKFNLWENIKILKQETIIWLYLNLDYLGKHIGRNEIFNTLVHKILSENNVGIGEYLLQAEDPILIDHKVYDPKTIPTSPIKATVEKVGLNSKFIYDNNDNISIEEALKREFQITDKYEKERIEFLTEFYKNNINRHIRDINKTKILEVSTLKIFNGFNIDPFQVLFDYWTYLLGNDIYGSFTDDSIITAKIDFTDPNTGIPYNITSRGGYYILLYVLLHNMDGLDLELDTVSITSAFDKNVNVENILTKSLFQDGYTSFFNPYLIENYPRPGKVFNSHIDVSTFLEKVLQYYKDIWLYASNSENSIVSANLKAFIYAASYHGKIKIHNYELNQTISELISNEGINFTIPQGSPYDHIATVKALFKSCLGVAIDSLDELQNFLQNLKEIQRKLTSYTLQSFGDISAGNEHYIYYNTNTMFRSEKGLIELRKDVLDVAPLNRDYFQSLFLALAPEHDLQAWGYNNRLNSKLIENYPTLGRFDMFGDEVYVSYAPSVSYDISKVRNDIPERLFPNPEQILLYLKEIKVVDGDTEYTTKFHRGERVGNAGAILTENNASVQNTGYVRGTAKVVFNDDRTPHDTSYIEKNKNNTD